MVIKYFNNKASKEIADGINSKVSRSALPLELHKIAIKKLNILNAATSLNDLILYPSLRFEHLKGDRKGQYSIRINNQYRICFKWTNGNAVDVEIVDYH